MTTGISTDAGRLIPGAFCRLGRLVLNACVLFTGLDASVFSSAASIVQRRDLERSRIQLSNGGIIRIRDKKPAFPARDSVRLIELGARRLAILIPALSGPGEGRELSRRRRHIAGSSDCRYRRHKFRSVREDPDRMLHQRLALFSILKAELEQARSDQRMNTALIQTRSELVSESTK